MNDSTKANSPWDWRAASAFKLSNTKKIFGQIYLENLKRQHSKRHMKFHSPKEVRRGAKNGL
jgi:hypothetical protein